MENHNNNRIYVKNIRETLNTHVSIDKQIKCCAFACPSDRQPVLMSVALFSSCFSSNPSCLASVHWVSWWDFLLLCMGFLILISLSATAYHNKQHVNMYLKPRWNSNSSGRSVSRLYSRKATTHAKWCVSTQTMLWTNALPGTDLAWLHKRRSVWKAKDMWQINMQDEVIAMQTGNGHDRRAWMADGLPASLPLFNTHF